MNRMIESPRDRTMNTLRFGRPDGFRSRLLAHLRPQPILLLPELGRERLAKVGGLEHLADLNREVGTRGVRAALDPFDRLLLRLHLPDPETGDQLLGLRERPVDHRLR